MKRLAVAANEQQRQMLLALFAIFLLSFPVVGSGAYTAPLFFPLSPHTSLGGRAHEDVCCL